MLSKKAKYALKAMLALAEEAGRTGAVLGAPDLARRETIPKKFLDLILFDLKTQGLVRGVRGKQGGYTLSRPPSEITAGEVVRAIDGPLAPIACASVNFYEPCQDCPDEAVCTVHLMMRNVREAISEVLDKMTLADALAERDRVRGPLQALVQP